MNQRNNQYLTSDRRKKHQVLWGHSDLERHFPLAKRVSHKAQSIVSRWTGNVISEELLIDAPEDEIIKYLSHRDVSFDIFLSQIAFALVSQKHKHVNVELSDLANPDFIRRTREVTRFFRRRADRAKVVIEITERGSAKDVYYDWVRASLLYLKNSWFTLCVDDFKLFPIRWDVSDVSRLILARHRDIISAVKIPHIYKDDLRKGWLTRRAITSIPLSMYIIAEGFGLSNDSEKLPYRVTAIQDPNVKSVDIF